MSVGNANVYLGHLKSPGTMELRVSFQIFGSRLPEGSNFHVEEHAQAVSTISIKATAYPRFFRNL
jgi:hypothetical protein